MNPMKRSLRVTLLSILLSLTLFTVLIIGLSGYLNLRTSAGEFTEKLLQQSAARVDQRVEEIVETAHRETTIMQHLFSSGVLDLRDFQRLASYWYEVVESVPGMSSIYFIRAEDGKGIHVVRSPEYKRVTIREVDQAPDGSHRIVNTYSARDYRTRSYRNPSAASARTVGLLGGNHGPLLAITAWYFAFQRDEPTHEGQPLLGVQEHPGFEKVQGAKDSAWTDTYLFFGERAFPSYPGVSYATPIFNADGKLLGVMGVGFNSFALCDFLKDLEVGKSGYAFVVEQRTDGNLQLIAHPDRTTILDEETNLGPGLHSALVELSQVRDPRVPEFMRQVPKDLDTTKLKHLSPLRFKKDGKTYLGGYRGLGTPKKGPNWLIGIVVPEDEVLGDAKKHLRIMVFVALAVLLLAVVLSVFTAGQVARPLEELVHESEAIGRLDLDARPMPHSVVREVDRLAIATADMKTSLRSFRKYVPADLVRKLMLSGQEAALGGERKRLTIYFSDIAGFTSISEAMAPEKLVDHLGEYLQVLSEQILGTGGTVDKYIGDAIMAFWGAPVEHPGHALAGCTAAIRNQQMLAKLRAKWQSEGKPLFEARIGINTGEVVVGNIGSAARLNYTVIGDAVNLASRLEGLNKYYGTRTLITEATYEEAKDGIVARPLDWVSVKGKHEAVLVYELLGLKGETEKEQERIAGLFGEGLQAYRRQHWSEAIRLFEQVLTHWLSDAPAREMVRRCLLYLERSPGAEWDGVHVMEDK
jgi:adenylate cyclase